MPSFSCSLLTPSNQAFATAVPLELPPPVAAGCSLVLLHVPASCFLHLEPSVPQPPRRSLPGSAPIPPDDGLPLLILLPWVPLALTQVPPGLCLAPSFQQHLSADPNSVSTPSAPTA